jgi:hypothetical protein
MISIYPIDSINFIQYHNFEYDRLKKWIYYELIHCLSLWYVNNTSNIDIITLIYWIHW